MRRERRSERGGPSERARAFLSLMQPFFRRSLLTCPPLDGAETARTEKAIKLQSPSQKSGGKKRAERGGGERKVFSFLRLRRRPRKVAEQKTAFAKLLLSLQASHPLDFDFKIAHSA